MFRELLKPALIIFSLALPVWLIVRKIIATAKRKRYTSFTPKQELLYFLFYIYIICVLITTVIPVPLTEADTPANKLTNFIPVINTVKAFTATHSPDRSIVRERIILNIVGNILLLFPLGMLLTFLSKKMYSLKKITLISFASSFFIEMVQLISRVFGNYRTVDVDDIILNTTGGILGFLLIRKYVRIKYSANPKRHTR